MSNTTRKERRYNRLFVKVYAFYALVAIMLALVLSLTFLNLYQTRTLTETRDTLFEKAKTISGRFTEFVINRDYANAKPYVGMLGEVYAEEIWTFTNVEAKYPLHRMMVTADINSDELQDNQLEVIRNAFAGTSSYISDYSEIHGSTVMMVGVPIVGIDGEFCGAVMLSSLMDSADKMVADSMRLVYISAILALAVSFIVSFILAKRLTKPITSIRQAALRLAAGQYDVKTQTKGHDEIADLARTFNFLSIKLQENEIERKNLERMRMDFFANVSHELRTPLTVVRAYTESLVDGVVTDSAQTMQYYERMLTECKGMERLVGDLLTLSKMQNPDFTIDKEPVNLRQVFDDIIRSARTIGQEKNITIEMNYTEEAYMVFADYDRIRQMFMVILDNAVKFSDESSVVHVALYRDDRIRVSIRDEGVGISLEEQQTIFDKFYRSKLRQNAKGSGLGLTIAKQIALRHDGNIAVESELGKGTTFLFDFPPYELSEEEESKA